MIYEVRTYRLQVGAIGEYLRLVGTEGIVIQQSYLGQLVGYFPSEIGPLNEITHIWAYRDLEDRRQRRQALQADPKWVAFLPKIQTLNVEMQNKILLPTEFSPLQ